MANQIPLPNRPELTYQKYYETIRPQLSRIANVVLLDSFDDFISPYYKIFEQISAYFWPNKPIQKPQPNNKHQEETEKLNATNCHEHHNF